MKPLQFAPWSSDIELAFYATLASLKIDKDRLDDSARKVLGLYELKPGDKPERSARMQIHSTALTTDEAPGGYYRAEGYIKNYNTIEEYKNADRSSVVELAGRTIWEAIHDETIYSCPSLLCSFYVLSFANLKKYKFTYHFAFPALHSDPAWKIVDDSNVNQRLEKNETTLLVESVQTWRYGVDARQHGFFLAKRVHKFSAQKDSKHEEVEEDEEEDGPQKTPQTPGLQDELGFQWVIGSLSKFKDGFFDGVDAADQFICFADPSTYPSNPGWQLRNLLVLIRQLWRLTSVQILCYRDTHARRDQANSLILRLQTDSVGEEPQYSPGGSRKAPPMPKVTGWERTDTGKLTSRTVDLAAYMDPTRLADQAVDLNLKLIKWRIAPNINLDVVKDVSCLLLGAGTLGSYVSRNLMGWGVRKITFVDNATVSFSNPVRQPLFSFKDCLDGGAKKAIRAAEMLKEIYPGVEAEGHVMSVPMAGHPILDEAVVKGEFDKLRLLIESHDVIFLLLDTRESRWLPTVMGKAANKIVMNAALGFDSFVVMRHGLLARGDEETELGCYFCNDVVAPADSIRDATLDQQCTVTRPGIAPIASAMLVELLVSILQHPLRARAPHTTDSRKTETKQPNTQVYSHPLGGVPHQIRGFLGTWNNISVEGRPYEHCSACSQKIVERYKQDGWDFVKRAINEKGWVEAVSGLAEVQRLAEEAEKDMDWDEDDQGAEEGDGELI
ncbi:E1-like protein-activating enzyme Gsa7p/Apg7p [Verruconis gallopava]|uniref:Ubiquitin-like modifier-activating enzyme ATG7 n=1 Tax=Verruconis gallopava TaxID=253628 RepID=A0A0D1XSB1_9PEZI|nr:E1-like protein-activating enzyme Gsa7p/Apg7p [Verruconis gallopava]KIW05636.1 E1-like protein-activating enzyme Gsa7p/Apg7p [Verruconis gallopava]